MSDILLDNVLRSDESTMNNNGLINSGTSVLLDDNACEHLSKFHELEFPEYKPSPEVQAIITGKTDDETKMTYMLRTLDELKQDNQYIKPVLRDITKQVRKTNGKVIALSSWNIAYGKRCENAAALAEQHEEKLKAFITGKDILKWIGLTLTGFAAGIITWIELLSKLSNN